MDWIGWMDGMAGWSHSWFQLTNSSIQNHTV